MRKVLFALPLLAAIPLAAGFAANHGGKGAHAGHQGHQMRTIDVSKVSGGDYVADQHHTQVMWEVSHFGFNDYYGLFGQITGSLKLDKANPANSKVSMTIPMAKVSTSRDGLTQHMMGPDFLDVAKYAEAKFESTSVRVQGQMATINGNLTMLGVTKPVSLMTHLSGTGSNMMNKKETVGFHATTKIKRSEWGMTKFIPGVGDEVRLKISAAFEK
jgi:polyisoprenoid-binding protein YceI